MQEKSLKSFLGSTVHYDSRSMNISKLLYTLAGGPLNSVKPKGNSGTDSCHDIATNWFNWH